MALKIQVTLMEQRDYIFGFKDFTINQREEMDKYITEGMKNPIVVHIHIRKWNV